MIDDALREELSALLDGALPETRAKELRMRIGKDAELRREYEELERAVRLVRALPRAGAPAELRTRVQSSLGEPRTRARIFRLAGLAAAAVVLLALGLALYLRDRGPEHFEAKTERAEPSAPLDDHADRKAKSLDEPAPAESGLVARDRAAEAPKKLGQPVPDAAGSEAPALEKNERSEETKDKDQVDLLAAVAKAQEVKHDERKAYLRQLAALPPEKAREHVRAVIPDESLRAEGRAAFAERRGGEPVLATILLEDREEADLVQRILGAAPPPADAGALASAIVEEEAKDRMSTEVEGTPEELDRLGRWLALLDLSQASGGPRGIVLGGAKAAQKEADEKVRRVVVRLRFKQPPEPKPATPPGK